MIQTTCDCEYVTQSEAKSYGEQWSENSWKNFNTTNAAILDASIGKAAMGGYSFFFSGPQVTSRLSGLSLAEGLKAFFFGVPENLPTFSRWGALMSGIRSFSVNYAIVNIGFLAGNGIGSAAVATGQTPLPWIKE